MINRLCNPVSLHRSLRYPEVAFPDPRGCVLLYRPSKNPVVRGAEVAWNCGALRKEASRPRQSTTKTWPRSSYGMTRRVTSSKLPRFATRKWLQKLLKPLRRLHDLRLGSGNVNKERRCCLAEFSSCCLFCFRNETIWREKSRHAFRKYCDFAEL